jgi:hypothetical protein
MVLQSMVAGAGVALDASVGFPRGIGAGTRHPRFRVGDYSTTHWADVAGDGSKVETILINLNLAGYERRTVRSAERWI